MLQISTGMYFEPNAPVHEYTHREVYFTNIGLITDEDTASSAPVELPIGGFTFATTVGNVNSVMVEVVDRLEKLNEDGSPAVMVATGGTEHLDDAADVLAFTLNVTISRDAALVRRLVPTQIPAGPGRGAAGILRRTCDPTVAVRVGDLERASRFMDKLLSLERTYYDAAIRAIRTVVDASLLVADEPGLAYTLYVAALESLAQLAIPAETVHDWERYDSKKRKLFETAFTDAALDPHQTELIRAAVMEADQLALARRFSEFTLNHVAPEFYRAEAAEAVLPIRAVDLPNALAVAYKLRSRNVHLLQELAPELWAVANRADTVRFERRFVLGLEGLNRLARHVVTQFVERSPSGVDAGFKYRDALPGKVRVELAAQYWIHRPDAFDAAAAPKVLDGLCTMLMPPTSPPPDMSAVLDRIEGLLPSTARSDARAPMVAIYCIWHTLLDPAHHRPNAASVIEKYKSDLDVPSAAAFAARLFAGDEIDWTVEELLELVEQRRRDRSTRRVRNPLPARIDAALLITAAEKNWEIDHDRALALISDAVETIPGDELMRRLEQACLDGTAPTRDSVHEIMRFEQEPAEEPPRRGLGRRRNSRPRRPRWWSRAACWGPRRGRPGRQRRPLR